MLIGCRWLVLMAMILALPASAVKNIFDDDWTPPPRTTKSVPTTKPVSKPVMPKTPDTANPSTTPPQTMPAIDASPTKRLPVPTSSEQSAIRKVMREVFASQLADRTPAGRRKLSESLFAQADKSAGIPAERYVVLAAAYEACVEAADLLSACRAADELGTQFDLDGLSVKVAAITSIGARPLTSAARESATANIRAALDVAILLAADDDYPAAVRACQALVPMAASAEPEAKARLLARIRDYQLLAQASAKIAPQVEKLKTSPDDPAANLAVGKYHCLTRNDWRTGLPLLANSGDTVLKDLAARELASPDKPEAIADLAEAWWDFATKQGDSLARACATSHAAQLYRQALPGLTGLRQELANRRLAAARIITDGASSSEPTSTAKATRTAVVIAADKSWQPTIDVKAGDLITFSATGLVTTNGGQPDTGPDGKRRGNRMFGRLRGQIGQSPWRELFMLGAEARHIAGVDGQLTLRADDDSGDGLKDNHGEFKVVITHTPAAKPPPTALGHGDQFVLPATDIIIRVMKAGAYDVTAEGEWSHVADGPLYSADGKNDGKDDSLAARWSETDFVILGKSGRLNVPTDGPVKFKVRDEEGGMHDNRGSVNVVIRPAK